MGASSASLFLELLKRVPQQPSHQQQNSLQSVTYTAPVFPHPAAENSTSGTGGEPVLVWMPYQHNALTSLVLYGVLAVLGTTLNIFQISSLFIQENLRRKGNVLLANLALANLLVSSVGFPVTIVAILAGSQGSLITCRWQWYPALLGFYTTVFTFLFIAAENYVRSCRQDRDVYSSVCGAKLVVFLMLAAWTIAISLVLVVTLVTGGLDVCERDMRESKMFVALCVPFALTVAVFAKAMHEQRDYTYNLELRNCLATREEILQRTLLRTNAIAYALFLLLWLPFLLTVIISPSMRSSNPGTSAVETLFFTAQCFSCICGCVYAFTHDAFRQGFLYLVHYFCCKSHPEFSKPPIGDNKTTSSIRVHVGMDSRVGERRHRYGKAATMGLLSFAGADTCRTRVEEDFL
ncbi:melatonin receptor type 1B-like [Rhipicephalus microplus]|uniref:melatonin receptor type 1B-like n=1 Tax=Rhipicephalus microplus TaxID=6941 RepID=UPI003F6CDB60